MPRFWLDYSDLDACPDELSLTYASVLEARDAALSELPEVAKAALPHPGRDAVAVTVRGENGRPLFTASLTLRSEWLDRQEVSATPSEPARTASRATHPGRQGSQRTDWGSITASERMARISDRIAFVQKKQHRCTVLKERLALSKQALARSRTAGDPAAIGQGWIALGPNRL